MPRCNPRAVTEAVQHIRALKDSLDALEPVLTETGLEDQDTGIDAAMDHRIPRDASPLLLRHARRRLLLYVAWLHDEATPQHRSWADDETGRAIRRLVEVQAAAKTARAKLH
jgi:hypothetical protein